MAYCRELQGDRLPAAKGEILTVVFLQCLFYLVMPSSKTRNVSCSRAASKINQWMIWHIKNKGAKFHILQYCISITANKVRESLLLYLQILGARYMSFTVHCSDLKQLEELFISIYKNDHDCYLLILLKMQVFYICLILHNTGQTSLEFI